MVKKIAALVAVALLALAGCDGDTYITNNNAPGGGHTTVVAVAVAPQVPAQNISAGAANQVLGGFEVNNTTGEALDEPNQSFTLHATSGTLGTTPITAISLYDENNVAVAGPVDAVMVGNDQRVTFPTSVVFPQGKHFFILKGKLPTDVSNDVVIEMSFNPRLDWGDPKGIESDTEHVFPNALVTMNPITVKTPTLRVTMSAVPAAHNITAGATGVALATITLDALDSGEDIDLSQLPLAKTFSAEVYTSMSACQLSNGATPLNTGGNIWNPSSADEELTTFDNPLTVVRGTVVSLLLKCDPASSAVGTFFFTVKPEGGMFAAIGATSGLPALILGAESSSAVMTIAGSNLTISTAPSSPSYQVVAGGATGVTSTIARLSAYNEGQQVDQIGVALTGAVNVTGVSIFDGGTLLGSVPITSSMSSAVVPLSTPLSIAADASKDVTAKLDTTNIGVGQVGIDGNLVTVDITSVGTHAVGAVSGSSVTPTGGTTSAGMKVYKTYPIFALMSLPVTGALDGALMRHRITASSKGMVSFAKWTYRVEVRNSAGSVVPNAVTGVNLYAFSDNACTIALPGLISGQVASPSVTPDANNLVRIRPPATINIPAGTTYCFELRGIISGLAPGYTVSTVLTPDTTPVTFTTNNVAGCPTGAVNNTQTGEPCPTAVNSLMGTVADLDAKNAAMVWSPNAVLPTSYTTTVDWTNGYGVYGIPSTGLSQTRTP